jgi:UDP-N-acetylmuramoyl-L-alanyl-D-glutamate--2,6-diaminopimelate ligase
MPDTISCAPGVRLRQLLPDAKFFGADDLVVRACTADSRTCREGDLFVAITGSNVDGHDYVREAAARGANGILAERYIPTHGLPICIAPDSRIALGKLCQALAGDPSRRLKVVGVTGTNGKTSTCWLIASVLEAGGYRTALTGTIVNSDSLAVEPSRMTTPSSPVLANWLARASANGCSHAVVEVSSHALAQGRTAGIAFDAACITNVRRDHLDFHNSLANYREAKSRLLKQLRPGGFAVLNADDQVACRFTSQVPGALMTIAIKAQAELTATVVERVLCEQTFLLQAGNDTIPVRTRIIGDAHVYNCLMAAAVGLVYDIPLTDVVRGIEQIENIPGRMERIECGQPFGVFVDYAHTPDALETVLGSLRPLVGGKLICVFGAGGERDREKRPLMGRAVESTADVAIVTDDNPRRDDPKRIRRDILRGFSSRDSVIEIADRGEAIHWALSRAQAGDCVLIAGKGHEDYQQIGSRRTWFDDRQVAQQWLYDHASEPNHVAVPKHRLLVG